MKKQKSNKIKRFGLWAVVIMTLISSVSLGVFVRPAVADNNQVSEAATKQLVAQKFMRCIGDWKSGNAAQGRGFSPSVVEDGKVFKGRDVNVGRWFEEEYYSEGVFSMDNGQVSCNDEMWDAFVKTFDLGDGSALMCDKSSDTGNGYYANGLFKSADGSACNSSAVKTPVSDEEAQAFVCKIYNESVKNNPYAKSCDDINSYGPEVGYELYQRDFLTQCSSSLVTDSTNAGKTYGTKVKVVEADGGITEKTAVVKSGASGSTKAHSFVGSDKISCDDLITKMNDYAELYAAKIKEQNKTDNPADGGSPGSDSSDVDDPTDGKGNTDDAEETAEEACYRRAGSMGWIICPVVFGMRDVADGIYGGIEKFIMVDDSIVSQIAQGTNSGSGSIYTAWNTFRGIANILFVILFLFVIFSQLTGFGIDNYGIKKMLPKLIVTAILINLSFVICAIAVDLSNIIGRSVHDFFNGLPVTATINGEQMSSDLAVAAKQVTGTIVDTFLVAGASIGIGAFVALNFWDLVIPIALFLLTFVIAIVFAFVVLGLRQAAVVILIVVAPLALALYALPNTEKVFKKWVDAFKGVLVVYPIIGALTGGGSFAGRVLLGASNDFLMVLTAGLLFVVPYFLIPSLMRKSLNAIGDLGNRLGNMRANSSNRLRNGVSNLEAVKNARADFSERNAQNRAERYFRSRRAQKDAAAVENGTASIRQSRRYKRNAGLVNTQRRANIEARSAQSQYNRLQSDTGYQAELSSANMAEADTAVKNFETMISAGDYAFDYYDEKGEHQTKLNAQDNSALEKALEHEIATSDGSNDSKARIRALSNALAGKGKDGRKRMFNAVERAQASGATNGNSENIQKAIQDFSTNIQNNHAGTMKDKFRPLYEFTKQAQVDGSGNISDFKYSAVDKFSTGDMANMDVTHLKDFVGADGKFAAGFTNTADQATLTSLAQQTLADEHLSQNLSGEQRSALQAIVAAGASAGVGTGGSPSPSSTEVKIDHSGGAGAGAGGGTQTSTPRIHNQDEVIRRVTAGELTPTQGDRWIEIMKNPTKAEQEFINRTNQKIADGTYTQEEANRRIQSMVDRSLKNNPNR